MSEMRRPPRRPGGPMGHGPGGIPGEKAKDFKGTMGKLLRYISSYTSLLYTSDAADEL